ncbi:hypothetical protein CTAYLR_007119 [Chrysophaeum taylorii]|uniref:DNA polymerase n=1 Tax=Chrysophaeum taylorii TaxID=2483200 RepID=A0AAD7U9C2_9STRA|nr:hypothetical protein CTAYLR_007119 [Chrysophaeum taylorii]
MVRLLEEASVEMYPVFVKGYIGSTPEKGAVRGLDYFSYPSGWERPINSPVVRIFGTTPMGQKVTAHVHGFFPYFYARPVAEESEAGRAERWETYGDEEFEAECASVETALDECLARESDDAAGVRRRVRSVLPASLVPFYGYHTGPKRFARIELFDPSDQRRAAELLFKGVVKKGDGDIVRLQPHESHVSFEMRFMVDFGLFGLAPVTLRSCRFRHAPSPRCDDRLRCRAAEAMTTQGAQEGHHLVADAEFWDTGVVAISFSEKHRCTSDDAIEVDACCAKIARAVVRERDSLQFGADCFSALPSLRDLFDEEARRLRADHVDDDKIREILAVSQEWLTPPDDWDAAPPSDDASTPRTGATIKNRGFWARELARLRHAGAPVSRPSSVSQAPLPASEADAETQEHEQLRAEFDEHYLNDDEDDEREDVDDTNAADHGEGRSDDDDDDAPSKEEEEDASSERRRPEAQQEQVVPPPRARQRSSPRRLTFASSQSSVHCEWSGKQLVIAPRRAPPSPAAVVASLADGGEYAGVVPEVVSTRLFYSERADFCAKSQREFSRYQTKDTAVWTSDVDALPVFDAVKAAKLAKPVLKGCTVEGASLAGWTSLLDGCDARVRDGIVAAPLARPPSRVDVEKWIAECNDKPTAYRFARARPEVAAYATPVDDDAFDGGASSPPKRTPRPSAKMRSKAGDAGGCRVSVLALEVLPANSKKRVRPQPRDDAVLAVAWRFRERFDDDASDAAGCVLVGDHEETKRAVHLATKIPRLDVRVVADERAALQLVADLVCRADPDVLVGWDLERDSFAFLADRARDAYKMDLVVEMSRVRGVKPPQTAPMLPAGKADGTEQRSSRYEASGIEVFGRMSLNAWREVSRDDFAKMRSYTLEAASEHLLKTRLPRYSPSHLAERFQSTSPLARARAVLHVARCCETCLTVVTELNTVGRAAEVARLFGMPLDEALFRGSQHRVEAVLLRIAKPRDPTTNPLERRRSKKHKSGYLPDEAPPPPPPDGGSDTTRRRWFVFSSPARAQVQNQPGLEAIAMTLEPSSRVYHEPVAVLDFRSLYPSMIIAYNLCFSTLICRLLKTPDTAIPERKTLKRRPREQQPRDEFSSDEAGDDLDGVDFYENVAVPAETHPAAAALSTPPNPHEQQQPASAATWGRLGICSYRPDAESAAALEHAEQFGARVYVAPNGAVFAPRRAREGLLPRALREILAARVMVKDAMKRAAKRSDAAEVRRLDARQLALKLLANVTYGYCSASFSGRQPCADLADAIVRSGRATLEVAIDRAGGAARPDALDNPVKYGDTDSLFVELPGRSLESAIAWGRRFAAAVTRDNPPAVALKFEYVFHGCVLQSKKRYAGLGFEDARGGRGTFFCKGMEPIRRDQCAFVADTVEKVLRALFTTRNLSVAKGAVVRAIESAYAGRRSLQDFVFRFQAKLGEYKREDANKVALVAKDLNKRGARILSRERVAFVITADFVHGANQLYRRARDVESATEGTVDVAYYVERQLLPALDRILGLVGIDVERWHSSIPQHDRQRAAYRLRDRLMRDEDYAEGTRRKLFITDHFRTDLCQLCHANRTQNVLCAACAARPAAALASAAAAVRDAERANARLTKDCVACAAAPDRTSTDPHHWRCPTSAFELHARPCDSFDCAVAYARRRVQSDAAASRERYASFEAIYPRRVADSLSDPGCRT